MPMGKIHGYLLGLVSNQYIRLSFYGNWSISFLRYSKLNIRPLKFKVKVMVKVKIDGPIWGLAFNWHICFSVWGQTTFSWDISNQNIWPWNSEVKIMAKVKMDGHIWNLSFKWYVCFSFHRNWIIFLRYSKFNIWFWNFKVKVKMKVKI